MNAQTDPQLFSPRRITPADAAAGLRLSTQAGWNQTRHDWDLMIRYGQGIGLVDPDEQLIATSILFPYRQQVDWISMVLVDEAWRQRGLGSRLLRLITELSPNPILGLDATDQGASIYAKLGFVAFEGITRWSVEGREVSTTGPNDQQAREILDETFRDLLVLFVRDIDKPRQSILTQLDPAGSAHFQLSRAEKTVAIASIRPGRLATHVGPLFATDAASALGLIRFILSKHEGSLLIDAPDRHKALAAKLPTLGFKTARAFTRMFRGGRPPANPNEYAIAGPEFG